jgi:hypothetical protein
MTADRLHEKIGSLSSTMLAELDVCLKTALGIT